MRVTSHLSDYERKQLQRIEEWRYEPPSIATRTFSRASGPASRAVQTLVPASLLRGALDFVQSAAERFAGRESILKLADVANIEALRQVPLERCDRLASSSRWRATAFAGGSGMFFGLAGAAGMTLDMSSLLVLTFRVIYRVGLCYGDDCGGNRRVPLAIFAIASANSEREKAAALAALDAESTIDFGSWRNGIERAAERELAKSAAQLSLNNLSRQFAKRLGWSVSAGALPVIGAAVGGGVNAWYLHDVAVAATRAFQARWLRVKYPNLGDKPMPGAGAITASSEHGTT
jgi:hypothetical protein